MKARARGLTLVEVLVAVALIAVSGVLGYRALDAIRHSADRLLQASRHWDAIELGSQRLVRDVGLALPEPWTDRAGRLLPPLWGRRTERGEAELVFVRSTAHTGVQRVGYRWRRAPDGGRLELLSYATPRDDAPARATLLLDGIEALEFSYLDAASRWQREWLRPELPRAVRLTLALADGLTVERIVDVPTAR